MNKLQDTYLREVGLLARRINYINDLELKKHNLQKGQYIFLTRICENPGITFSELTSLVGVDKTTTTKAIAKLIKAGYASKELNVKDKRVYNLFPTQSAKVVYDFVLKCENEKIAVCFAEFEVDEQIKAKELIKKMNENLEKKYVEELK